MGSSPELPENSHPQQPATTTPPTPSPPATTSPVTVQPDVTDTVARFKAEIEEKDRQLTDLHSRTRAVHEQAFKNGNEKDEQLMELKLANRALHEQAWKNGIAFTQTMSTLKATIAAKNSTRPAHTPPPSSGQYPPGITSGSYQAPPHTHTCAPLMDAQVRICELTKLNAVLVVKEEALQTALKEAYVTAARR